MKTKKISSFLLCTLMVLSMMSTASAESMESVEHQIKIINDNFIIWNCDSYNKQFSYAVTDLDGNGRLELLAASTQGSGKFTTGRMFEVNSSYNGMFEVKLVNGEGDFIPDIVVNQTEVYKDSISGSSYYIFTDDTPFGQWSSYSTQNALLLKNGIATWLTVAEKSVFTNGTYTQNTYSSKGNLLSEQQYIALTSNCFPGYTKTVQNFGWFKRTDGSMPVLLSNSYNIFRVGGYNIEVPQIVPVIPTGSNGNITITKNPTAESLPIGGTNWFIAHATGAEKLTWQFIDPNSRIYSMQDTMALNPGLRLEMQPNDTLAIINVPASLNGWFAQAVFSNSKYSAASQPAAIYVGDYVGAYSSIISSYRSAYLSGRQITQQLAQAYNISEMAGYSEHVGYGMKDLDKDGIPELLITGTGSNNFSDQIIYEICTLINNQPLVLCRSSARDRYYLRTDSTVYNVGSNGAADASYNIFRFRYGTLRPVEKLRSALDGQGSVVWYLDASGDGNEVIISEGSANSKIKAYQNTIFMPYLTKIA